MKSILVVIIILCVLATAGHVWWHWGDARIEEAETSYQEGVSARTIAGKQEAFNHALDLFLQLETEYHPNLGNGRLYYNIGNTYFQLGEYPEAILYYLRAQQLMPNEERAQRNLAAARDKLALPKLEKNNWLESILLYPLPLPTRLQILSFGCITSLLLYSGWIWIRLPWLRNSAIGISSAAAIVGISVVITHYFSPVHAVLIHAAELRRDAGMSFAMIGDQPVPAGTVVEVLGISADGNWLKIVIPNADADFGFIPETSASQI